eukprot:SAG31_NODE_6386_length_2036_cov_1.597832_1_plen_67_part_10
MRPAYKPCEITAPRHDPRNNDGGGSVPPDRTNSGELNVSPLSVLITYMVDTFSISALHLSIKVPYFS